MWSLIDSLGSSFVAPVTVPHVEHNDVIGEGGMEAITTSLEVGDHFVVVVGKENFEDANFWISIIEQILHVVDENTKEDCWGQNE